MTDVMMMVTMMIMNFKECVLKEITLRRKR